MMLLVMACVTSLDTPSVLSECGVPNPYTPDLSQWTLKDPEKGLMLSSRCKGVAALSTHGKIWGYMTQTQISDPMGLESEMYSKWGHPRSRVSTVSRECVPLYSMLSEEFVAFMDDGDGVIDCQTSTHYLWTDTWGRVVWASATPNEGGVSLSVLWADNRLAPFPIAHRASRL